MKDDTNPARQYVTRKGDSYTIQFVKECPPGSCGRFRWFLLDVSQKAETTRRGVWLHPEFQMRITRSDRWADFSDEALLDLIFMRVAIALERGEPDGRSQKSLQPDVDFGYVFTLLGPVNSMALAKAALAEDLEKSRKPAPIGFNQQQAVR